MLFEQAWIDAATFERHSGWRLRPEGLCRADVCVPLPAGAVHGPKLDITTAAERLGVPLVHDPGSGLWALGPPAGGKTLPSATAPDLVLPDLDGQPFDLATLHGRKVLVLAWASW
jgi:hypothetical protein